MTDTEEGELSVDGANGAAIPQVYTSFDAQAVNPQTGSGCAIDGLPPGGGAWPYAIAGGYEGVENADEFGDHFTSWQSAIRWSLCHNAPPLIEFDWTVPGGRG
jgi:hypothetical protein